VHIPQELGGEGEACGIAYHRVDVAVGAKGSWLLANAWIVEAEA